MNPQSSQSPVTIRHILAYVAIMVLVPMLAALDAGLANGSIPLPPALTPFVPVFVAGLVALTMALPRVTDATPPVPPPELAPLAPTRPAAPAPLRLVPRSAGPAAGNAAIAEPEPPAASPVGGTVLPPATPPYVTR